MPGEDDDSPFLRFIGLEEGLSENGVGSVSLAIQPHHLQGAGQVHGGLMAVLVDTAFFRAVRSTLAPRAADHHHRTEGELPGKRNLRSSHRHRKDNQQPQPA